MANGSCCQLVGDLQVSFTGCLISINTSCSTESIVACGEENPLPGPSSGSLNITGFADTVPWVGCPSKAGLSLSYIRKYDCDNDVLYFIPSGQGQSFVSGDIERYAKVKYPLSSCMSMSASSTSGPASIYMLTEQTNGYGLVYTGSPISINTTPGMEPISLPGLPGPTGPFYLQSFNLEAQPGQIPTASYSFVFSIEEN